MILKICNIRRTNSYWKCKWNDTIRNLPVCYRRDVDHWVFINQYNFEKVTIRARTMWYWFRASGTLYRCFFLKWPTKIILIPSPFLLTYWAGTRRVRSILHPISYCSNSIREMLGRLPSGTDWWIYRRVYQYNFRLRIWKVGTTFLHLR